MKIKYDPILGKLREDDSGVDGTSSYTYIAYASDNTGTDFSLTPSELLPYRAEIVSATAITTPTLTDFAAAAWVKYIGEDGVGFSPDAIGLLSGLSTYDDEPAGFSYLASDTGDVYFKLSSTTGDWSGAIPFQGGDGEDGASITSAAFVSDDLVFTKDDLSTVTITNAAITLKGADGADGADGTSSYTYIAYASDNAGTGFSLTPSALLPYRAEIVSATIIATPTLTDFAGATWVKYIGEDGEDGGMTNPMTAAGDIIIGGTSGTPTALAKSTDGKVLKLVSGAPAWADESGSGSGLTAAEVTAIATKQALIFG